MTLTGKWLLPVAAALAVAPVAAQDLAKSLPEVEGWSHRDPLARYTPQTLYEYINGAADGFLDCGFRELVSQIYRSKGDVSVTVEVYLHEDPVTAFGIYSQERPTAGDFLAIGGQGYYEKGTLNFFKGSTYVKLSGFQLGAEDRNLLVRFARATAERIPGEAKLPAILLAFPPEGKVPGTERFILKDFLGYPFLGSAFVADYKVQGREFKVWAMAAPTEDKAKGMLAQYLKAQGASGDPVPGKVATLTDKFNGPLSFLWLGKQVLGVVGGEPAVHGALLERFRGAVK
jgi:hypothetical protein